MKNVHLLNLCLCLILILLTSCGRQIPDGLGINENGRLLACPDSPNCVSTQSKIKGSKIKPIQYQNDDDQAFDLLVKMIKEDKAANIIKSEKPYIHAAYYTKMKVFIDDVEFFQDVRNKQFHFRSASRVGHSDLGKNRSRMEEIRSNYNTAQK